ncbi:PTS transporter subunit EIIC [Collinsella stercoris]|uniref:PTS transporter subunit EIIC n=1 Tax=Collinsella stercoris TaxID=147206 RepID=UPI002EB7427B|nr:PTS transporter subunit EIIC [Collinsella stercoris]
MANNKQIAADVLEAVGGKSNVSFVTHCMTRLRFTLKDRTVPDAAAVKKLNGVLGAQESGGQFQVIIGQNVPKVYDELCALGGFSKQAAIDENLDGTQAELSLASIGKGIMNYLAGSMTPMIPVLLAAGLFKTIGVVLGPTMLGVMAADSDLVRFMDMIYNAAFYFMPIYLGFNASRQIGLTPILGAFLGGMLIEPTFVSLAAEGTPLSVYGFLPCVPGAYAQTVLPILLTIPVAYAIERIMRKHLPDALQTVFSPFLTLGITLPVSLCLLAPMGSWLGNGLADVFEFLGTSGGIISIISGGLLAAAWVPMVITGMHMALIGIAQVAFLQAGFDPFIFVAINISLWPVFATQIATFLRLKLRDEKSACAGYLVAQLIGGVGEPFIYGMDFRYPKLFLCSMAGSFVSGAIALALGVTAYVAGLPSNLLSMLTFVGGGTENLLFACIAAAVGFAVSFAATWFFGFSKDEIENGPVSERD